MAWKGCMCAVAVCYTECYIVYRDNNDYFLFCNLKASFVKQNNQKIRTPPHLPEFEIIYLHQHITP